MAGSHDPRAQRVILRFARGHGPASGDLAARLRGVGGVEVLDEAGLMMLVAGPRGEIERVLQDHPGWTLIPETQSRLP
ncbi:MAG: hypothetical protein ABW051_03625 [Burkholderiaceae bacterium]